MSRPDQRPQLPRSLPPSASKRDCDRRDRAYSSHSEPVRCRRGERRRARSQSARRNAAARAFRQVELGIKGRTCRPRDALGLNDSRSCSCHVEILRRDVLQQGHQFRRAKLLGPEQRRPRRARRGLVITIWNYRQNAVRQGRRHASPKRSRKRTRKTHRSRGGHAPLACPKIQSQLLQASAPTLARSVRPAKSTLQARSHRRRI